MQPLILLLGIGAYLYYQQAQQFKAEYKIRFVDGSFNLDKTTQAGFTRLYFTIRLEVQNPTSFTGTLQSAVFNLYYNNSAIGIATIPIPVTIVKNGITKVELPVAVPTEKLVTSVEQIINAIGNRQSIIFNIKGQLKFAIGTLTVSENYKVPFI